MKKKLVLLIAPLLVTACLTSQPVPTSTPIPPSSTPIPPTSTPHPPTNTPIPLTPEPTLAPIRVTSLEEIEGVWHDGDHQISIYASGSIIVKVIVIQAWFEDGLLHTRYDFECTRDLIGVYEVYFVPGEYLVIEAIDEPCWRREGYIGLKWLHPSAR